MAFKTYWFDKRHLVNGRDTNYDNRLNLTQFIRDLSEDQIQNSEYLAQAMLDSAAQVINAVTPVTESYAALETDYRILVDQTDSAVTITLPETAPIGKAFFVLAETYTDPIVIESSGDLLVNGSADYQITAQYGFVEVILSENGWYIVNKA